MPGSAIDCAGRGGGVEGISPNKSNNYLSFGATPLPDIDKAPPPPPEISKTTAGGFSNRISGLVSPPSKG
jgi:hypothetical protein